MRPARRCDRMLAPACRSSPTVGPAGDGVAPPGVQAILAGARAAVVQATADAPSAPAWREIAGVPAIAEREAMIFCGRPGRRSFRVGLPPWRGTRGVCRRPRYGARRVPAQRKANRRRAAQPCECRAPRPDIFPARRRAAGHGLEETRSVRGWDRRNAHFFQLILSLAAHYGFDVDAPRESLPKDVQQAVMYGSGKEKSPSATSPSAAARSPANIRSRASCPAWTVVIRKRNRPRCARLHDHGRQSTPIAGDADRGRICAAASGRNAPERQRGDAAWVTPSRLVQHRRGLRAARAAAGAARRLHPVQCTGSPGTLSCPCASSTMRPRVCSSAALP